MLIQDWQTLFPVTDSERHYYPMAQPELIHKKCCKKHKRKGKRCKSCPER